MHALCSFNVHIQMQLSMSQENLDKTENTLACNSLFSNELSYTLFTLQQTPTNPTPITDKFNS